MDHLEFRDSHIHTATTSIIIPQRETSLLVDYRWQFTKVAIRCKLSASELLLKVPLCPAAYNVRPPTLLLIAHLSFGTDLMEPRIMASCERPGILGD
uniref:Uncharacterized protein n=1 Tax=Ascaris lumbricoides TaxID=6252 RepID=A0A0M3I3Z3_ASCLU